MGSNDLSEEIFGDAQEVESAANENEEKLGKVARLVKLLQEANAAVALCEDNLKRAKEIERDLAEFQIPDLFDEMGLSQLKMDDDSIVKVDRSFAASITVEKKDGCLDWLNKNGHGSLIKHDVTVKIKKGEETEYEKTLEHLKDIGATYTDKEYVHPMTLKSFVKEQIENGADFPQEQFSVFPVRKTKIK